jgi:hypothetical protein
MPLTGIQESPNQGANGWHKIGNQLPKSYVRRPLPTVVLVLWAVPCYLRFSIESRTVGEKWIRVRGPATSVPGRTDSLGCGSRAGRPDGVAGKAPRLRADRPGNLHVCERAGRETSTSTRRPGAKTPRLPEMGPTARPCFDPPLPLTRQYPIEPRKDCVKGCGLYRWEGWCHLCRI